MSDVNEMEAAELMKCPHCNATPKIRVIGEMNPCYAINCECGVYTKLFKEKSSLIALWNMRRGKKFEMPTLQVTPPPTRGTAGEGTPKISTARKPKPF